MHGYWHGGGSGGGDVDDDDDHGWTQKQQHVMRKGTSNDEAEAVMLMIMMTMMMVSAHRTHVPIKKIKKTRSLWHSVWSPDAVSRRRHLEQPPRRWLISSWLGIHVHDMYVEAEREIAVDDRLWR